MIHTILIGVLTCIAVSICWYHILKFFENIKTIADYYKTLTEKTKKETRYFGLVGGERQPTTEELNALSETFKQTMKEAKK